MALKNSIKEKLNQCTQELYGINKAGFNIEYPPQREFGDYSSNIALVIAGQIEKNPKEISSQIINWLEGQNIKEIDKMQSAGSGFINFYLKRDVLINELEKILKQGEAYAKSTTGKGKTMVLDYSAPNIAKKMHIGHLRSTVIGAALYNIFSSQGYQVIRDNHLGDWGTQFGKLIYEYKNRYGEKLKKDMSVDEMEEMYIAFHKKTKKQAELEEQARRELVKLQRKDKFNYQLWKLFYKISLAEFKRIYKLLEVDFELWYGESFYNDKLSEIVEEALQKGVAKKSQNAVIIDLDKFDLPPLMIQKTDGGYLYGTTDLATIKYRIEKLKADICLYVVANQQALYFEQLFKASQLLDYHHQEELKHIKFGLILGKGGKKMSTREGEVADLENLINQGIQKSKQRIKQKNKDLTDSEIKKNAQMIAIGAIRYNDLSQNRLNDIVFDWDRMLKFEHGSSPYLQYTYVRIKSILSKAGKLKKGANLDKLQEAQEINLLKRLIRLPEIIEIAAQEYRPNLIADYLQKLAADFHIFYEQIPVIKADEQTKQARLKLIKAVAQVIQTGLGLLGIKCPEKM